MADPTPKLDVGAQDVLNGWKEIAVYLDRSVRSTQRWERDLGLPVHRISTPDGGKIVYATRQEIDRWRHLVDTTDADATPARDAWHDGGWSHVPGLAALRRAARASAHAGLTTIRRIRHSRWVTAGVPVWVVLVLMAGAAGLTYVATAPGLLPGRPTQIEFVGEELRAFTDAGRLVWTHPFGRIANHARSIRGYRYLGDADGDGVPDVVVPVRFALPNGMSSESDTVYAFREDGAVIWTVQPSLDLRDEIDEFGDPWHVRDIVIAPDGSGRTWIAYSHHTWRPGVVIEVDGDGARRLRYLQEGRVSQIGHWSTPDREYLAAGGTINEHSRASLAIIDLAREPAHSPIEEGPRLTCHDCPEDLPEAFILLPHAEVTTALMRPYGWVGDIDVQGDRLKVVVDDGFGPIGSVLSVSPELIVDEYERSDAYWRAHRTLEEDGRILHTVDECPERYQTHEIRAWSRTSGWSAYEVAPSVTPPGVASSADDERAVSANGALDSSVPEAIVDPERPSLPHH